MSRVVLITGGNRGIGLACVNAFLKQGDKVALTYRSAPPAGLEGENVMALQCDVTDADSVEAAFKAIEEQWGPVQVLVSNAGVTKDNLLMRMSEEEWDTVLDTNLKATWRVAKRASRGMMKAKSGRMVFMSSVVGMYGSPGQTNYGASKAGLVGLARSITRELGPKGITANVIAPGPVATDMLDALGEEGAARLVNLVPMQRAVTPEEVAHAVTFLASQEAAMISGAILPVDGGMGTGH